ncbi:MAG: hypothetical protein GF364_15000, partial [Candidatus Lokiarchaeota archaeon]|nr:hypothetical protein [Candidatus Lokiarchaeota archaeon]
MYSNHRNPYRKIFYAALFSVIMLFPIFINSRILISENLRLDEIENVQIHDIESSSLTDLETSWTGSGNNKTVKTYLLNQSSCSNQQDEFNISVDTSPSEISYGDFNFTFDSDYNTQYQFEQDSPLLNSNTNVSSRANQNWQPSNATGVGTDHLLI